MRGADMTLTIVIKTNYPNTTKSLLRLVQKWLASHKGAVMDSWTQEPEQGDKIDV